MKPIAYRELDIDAPAAKVWDVIKDPMDLHYLPRVRKVDVVDGGARRIVHIDYSDVAGYDEVQLADEACYNIDHEAHTYQYTWVGDYLPITDHVATVKIHENGPDKAKFVWSCVWTLTKPLSEAEEREMAKSVEDIWWSGMNRVKDIAEAA